MSEKGLFKERGLYCQECQKVVDFRVVEKKKAACVFRKNFKYTARLAFCNECNCELYHGQLYDENLTKMHLKYKEIVSKSEMED